MTLLRRYRGHYLGTEIDEKWWRRETKGLLSRGLGEGWIEGGALCFRRLLTRNRIVIPLRDMVDVRVGTLHSGRWASGSPVIKIDWRRGDRRLSSGFVFSSDPAEAEVLVRELHAEIARAQA